MPWQGSGVNWRKDGIVSALWLYLKITIWFNNNFSARYPPYSDRKASLLSFLLRKRRPLPNLYLSHVLAGCLGVGLTFLWNYYLQVRKVYILHPLPCRLYCVTINCNYFTRQCNQTQRQRQRTNTMYMHSSYHTPPSNNIAIHTPYVQISRARRCVRTIYKSMADSRYVFTLGYIGNGLINYFHLESIAINAYALSISFI